MDKVTCEVVSDLLPLYCDDVCTPGSRRLVEEHLQSCADCRSMLEKMKTESFVEAEELQGENIMKSMADVWKKSVIRSFAKGLLFAVCGFLILYAAYWGLVRWPTTVIGPEAVQADVSVEDSRYTAHIMTIDGYKSTSVDVKTQKDGKMFIMLKRGIIPIKNGGGAVYGGNLSGELNVQLETGEMVQVEEIYYGTSDSCILLWKETDASQDLKK